MVSIELTNRLCFWQIVLGVIAIVSAVASFFLSKSFKSNQCTDRFLLIMGLIKGPIGVDRTASSCARLTGLWAIVTFMAGFFGTASWTYNSESTANGLRYNLNTTLTSNGSS